VRREVVRELTSAGMSTRAIAPVVGVTDRQVRYDVEQVFRTEHLSAPAINPETGEVGPDYPEPHAPPETTNRPPSVVRTGVSR